MINRLALPLFILGLVMISFSLGRGSAGIDVKSAKDIQNTPISSSIATPTVTPIASSGKSLVTKVIDGDTVDVQINGQKETVRLIGINAPETNECFGKEATDKAKELLNSKSVNLESDPTQGERDKYQRLLRYIFVDGNSFEELMVKNGFAKEYTYNKAYKYQSLYRSAQIEAQNNKRGLWADGACSTSNNEPKSSENVQYQVQGSYTCDCSKLCSQIATCDEAYYQLNQCGCSARDSDKDGIPCESLCK